MGSTQFRGAVILAAVVLVSVMLVGCPPKPPTVVTVDTAATAFIVGNTVTFTATSTSADDTDFTWSVDNPQLLRVVAKGTSVQVECIGAGAAKVTATGVASGVSGVYLLTVTEPVVEQPSHAGRYSTYEGSKTCAPCHPGKAEEVHASIHYQWDSETGGKMTGINGFCTYPAINFIGLLKNADGDMVSGGCAQCHVGMGAKPALDVTDAQLDNIDCLVCHGPRYKRKVALLEDNTFGLVPDEAAMGEDFLDAITDVVDSTPTTCLNCHAKAGGGYNNKRGDIEPEHYNPTRDFDVHLSSVANGGAGLKCTSCHTVQNHRIAGQGSDLRPTDSDVNLRCTSCHDAAPHESDRLNAHTGRLDCTVCHISHFAKGATGTGMYRDFTMLEYEEAKKLYEPTIHREHNVVPAYRFWDGTQFIASFGDPVTYDTVSGNVINSAPNGDVNTAGAKIFPFKLHHAMQPIRNDDNSLIGLKMGVIFMRAAFDPNAAVPTVVPWLEGATEAQVIDTAVRAGASASGKPLAADPSAWGFVQSERWMGVFHQVQPAEQALSCTECHFGGERIDFDALGYQIKDDPDLCASCHGGADFRDVWSGDELFTEVHARHVDGMGMNCSACHNFSAAQ